MTKIFGVSAPCNEPFSPNSLNFILDQIISWNKEHSFVKQLKSSFYDINSDELSLNTEFLTGGKNFLCKDSEFNLSFLGTISVEAADLETNTFGMVHRNYKLTIQLLSNGLLLPFSTGEYKRFSDIFYIFSKIKTLLSEHSKENAFLLDILTTLPGKEARKNSIEVCRNRATRLQQLLETFIFALLKTLKVRQIKLITYQADKATHEKLEKEKDMLEFKNKVLSIENRIALDETKVEVPMLFTKSQIEKQLKTLETVCKIIFYDLLKFSSDSLAELFTFTERVHELIDISNYRLS
eukprot:snap_masked-scaffold_36-processed-gene-2.103-mRNA-1 protein AED:1.00 eAED:1.00 QI:0/-1/0/0/-1/1/1/0/294